MKSIFCQSNIIGCYGNKNPFPSFDRQNSPPFNPFSSFLYDFVVVWYMTDC